MAIKILEVDVTAVLENPPLFSLSNIIMFFRSLFFWLFSSSPMMAQNIA